MSDRDETIRSDADARELNTGSIGKGALHLTTAKFTTTLIALLTSMLLSRFRTLEEYGTYSQLLTIITLAASLFMLGLPNSCNFFLARADNGEERRTFLSVYYMLNTIIGIVIGAALLLGIPFFERYFDNPRIRSFAYFLALYPLAHITIAGISNVLVVYGRTGKLMQVNIVTSLVALVSVIAVQLLHGSFADYMMAFLAGNLGIAVWNYTLVLRLERGIRPQFSGELIRKIFHYSIPIGLATLVGTLDVELDKLMIGNLLGAESFAIYANAGKELPLTIISASLTAVLLPQLAQKLKRNENREAVELWGITIELSYLAMCFFATAAVVFAPQIMALLYSEKYLPGVNVFRVYSLVLLLRTTYFGIVLNSSGKTKFIFWSSVVTLAVNIVLNLLLYYGIGFVGPAIATFLSIVVCDACQLLVTSRLLAVPMRAIFPWRALGEITLLNLLWGMAAHGILQWTRWGTDLRGILLSVAFGAVVTVLYLAFFKRRILRLWNAIN